MPPSPDASALVRQQLPEIIAGTFFLWAGFVAFAIAIIRRRGGVRLLVRLGVWTTMYGIQELVKVPLIVGLLPASLRGSARFALVFCSYFVLVAAALTFLELSTGLLRVLIRFKVVADATVGVFGLAAFFLYGSDDALLPLNALLAAVGLAMITAFTIVPRLSRRNLVLQQHRILTVGMLIFTVQALHVNLARSFNYRSPGILSPVGFAVLLLALGYTALNLITANERRLFSIDNELELARQLQFSILPAETPVVEKLRIAATYLPMTAVAGDFYQFLSVDNQRLGFLVADVSGHGVPAALIASMIKTAMHSVDGCADAPSEVLQRLGKVLCGDLRGQFVSAAYLWLDAENRTAKYAAAGHPPLLLWRAANHQLEHIESNGLLFGVVPEFDIPQCAISLAPGDRLLLYTDGVIEPENQAGEAFGDHRLEHLIREQQASTADEFSARIVSEIRAWQPASTTQQDDITLIVIDVLA